MREQLSMRIRGSLGPEHTWLAGAAATNAAVALMSAAVRAACVALAKGEKGLTVLRRTAR
jgi:hypothetical protein